MTTVALSNCMARPLATSAGTGLYSRRVSGTGHLFRLGELVPGPAVEDAAGGLLADARHDMGASFWVGAHSFRHRHVEVGIAGLLCQAAIAIHDLDMTVAT